MKKILALFLTMAVAFSFMTAGAYAASDDALSVSCKLYDGYTIVTVRKSGTVYYTTNGSKPTNKSRKYTSRIRVTEPCSLRLVSYVNGKASDYLTKKIPVRLAKPKAELVSAGKTYTYVVTVPDGAAVYMTTDGTKPSKSNGDLVQGGMFTVSAKKSAKLVCVKKGWRNSKVTTVRARGASDDTSSSQSTFEDEVLRLVNEQRAANGLSKFTTDSKLTQVAKTRAKELTQEYSHTRPDGTSCFTAFSEVGIYYSSAGENIAEGYKTPESVVEGWMNSEGHRANILNPKFSKMGVGYAEDSGNGRYWVQVFTS